MKIVVTGGAGFIGSHLTEKLLDNGHEVIVVDNLSTGYEHNLDACRDRITFVEGNAGDPELMSELLPGVDTVYHQAALTSVPRSMEKPMETFSETLKASVNVFECSRLTGVRRVVYAASSSCYGDRPEDIKTEDLYPMPISPYAAAKISTEMFAQAYSAGFGLETIGLRYFNVFGPRQDPNGTYAAVIPLFIKMMMSGQAPTITGDGNQSRDFTYVANVVHANLLALDCDLPQPGVFVNIATGRRVTLPELVSSLNTVAGTSFEPQLVPPRPGDVRHSLASIEAAQKILGYQPVATFEEGLEATWKFAQENWS